MFRFLKIWAERRRLKAYREGYNYAAGALLRYEETPASLQAYTYGSSDVFDKGINAACRDLLEARIIEDDTGGVQGRLSDGR